MKRQRYSRTTYRIPQFEGQVQVAREAFTVLEPLLALRLDLGAGIGRSGISLQRQIIQVGADGNPQSAVIVVDERQPRISFVSTKSGKKRERTTTHFTLKVLQSFRSRLASPFRRRPVKITSIRFRNVERTAEIKER